VALVNTHALALARFTQNEIGNVVPLRSFIWCVRCTEDKISYRLWNEEEKISKSGGVARMTKKTEEIEQRI
jgi:hypothetical protein